MSMGPQEQTQIERNATILCQEQYIENAVGETYTIIVPASVILITICIAFGKYGGWTLAKTQ